MGVYGAADSTLVNMAYHASKANVPLDQTAVFAAREENLKDFTKNLSNLFENQYKDHKKTEKDIVNLGQKAEEILLGGGNVNEFQMDTHYNTILGYSAKNDAIKNNKELDKHQKERARNSLQLEMNKYKNSIADQGETMQEMINNSANAQLFSTMDSNEAKLWKGILTDYVDGTNTAPESIVNGEKFYTMTIGTEEVSMSLREIREGLSAHDPEVQLAFAEKLNTTVGKFKDAQQNGLDINENQMLLMKNDLLSGINSWGEVRNIANGKFGSEPFSFEEVLHGQAKTMGLNGHAVINNGAIGLIYNELDKLGANMGGQSAIDMDGDGDFDEEDARLYRLPENAKTMIEKLKKDKHLYKELVVNYTMATAVKDVWGQQTMAAVDATRVEAEKNATKQDLSVEEYERKQEIAGRENRKTKGMLSGNEAKKQQEEKQLITAIGTAISSGKYGDLHNLERGVKLSKDKTELLLQKNGVAIKGPKQDGKETYVSIKLEDAEGNKKSNEEIQAEIRSYIIGNVGGDPTAGMTPKEIIEYYKNQDKN